MSDCGCQPIPEINYAELFCKIDDALKDCPFTLELIIETFYPPNNKNYKRKKIGGFDKIRRLYNECIDGGPNPNALWDARGGCAKGTPSDIARADYKCNKWAQAVDAKMNEIKNTINNMRIFSKCRPGAPPISEDPQIRINTVCRAPFGNPSPVFKPLF